MRRSILIILILCFLVAYESDSSAFWWKQQKQETAVPEVKEAEQKKKKEEEINRLAEEKRARMRELKEKKRKQLNNTEWRIELSVFGAGAKEQKDTDIITFKDNQVSSANLSRGGFSATNYTLTIQQDETLIWETMQTSNKGGIAFWRGELDPKMEKMRGVLSHHLSDKTAKDYSFSSTGKKAVASSQE
jgi:hypothetical protein